MSSIPFSDGCSNDFTCEIEESCSRITADYYSDTPYMIFIELFRMICSTCGLITAYLILYDKRISAHPGFLIALISLFQGGYIFAYNQNVHLCITHFHHVLSYLSAPFFPNLPVEKREFYAFFSMIVTNRLLRDTFKGLFLVFCIFYSYDLYLILKNPLYPQKKRMRWYVVIASIVLIFGVVSDSIMIKKNIGSR